MAQCDVDEGNGPMSARSPVLVLIDVDNTLLDNDRTAADLSLLRS